MSDGWLVIVVLAGVTVAIRAAGPVLIGGRRFPPRAMSVIALLSPALLGALVATDTFGSEDRGLVVDFRALGLAGAVAVLLLRRDAMLPAAAVAVALTALARTLFGA